MLEGQFFGDLALQAAGESDEALRVLRQKPLADARLVVEAVERGLGGDLHQVAVALVVLSQHDEVVVAVALRRRAMVFFLADVQLAAQDGLHAYFFGGVGKLDRSEDVAVVGHGHGGHVEFLDALHQLGGIARAIEHGVIGVQVKMNELLRHSVRTFAGSCLLYAPAMWKSGPNHAGRDASRLRVIERASILRAPAALRR